MQILKSSANIKTYPSHKEAKVYTLFLFIFYLMIKTDLQSSREYIQKRGAMVSFLLFALMVTGWVSNFQEPINENIVAYMEQTMGA